MRKDSKKNMLLLSGSKATGNLPDGVKPGFLEFAEPWIKKFFAKAVADTEPVLFVPYARPSGESEVSYFKTVQSRFKEMGIDTVCAPEAGITAKDLKNIGGIFIGGGHTYTLLHKLQQNGALELIRRKVEAGLPYLGSSAGTMIACPTIKTTNDMPGAAHDVIDLKALGLIGAQLNCHYMNDAMHDPKHQGETRDTRLKEFCTLNPGISVLGLFEGQALRIAGNKTHILTSERCRGTKPPVFIDDRCEEVTCEIGVPKDVSQVFAVSRPPARKGKLPAGRMPRGK
ncbi:MAG: dipeptidase PepE [Bryobacteraceae bacterium]